MVLQAQDGIPKLQSRLLQMKSEQHNALDVKFKVVQKMINHINTNFNEFNDDIIEMKTKIN